MLKQSELNSMKKGDPIDHFLLIKKCELRLTKANKQFLSLELGDRSVTLTANIWDGYEPVMNIAQNGGVVKITGSLDEYLGSLQIKISSIKACTPDEGVSPLDFLAHSKRECSVMQQELNARINNIQNLKLRLLLKEIFKGERYDKFCTAPAGKHWHHSYIHGLIEHTLELIKICDLMCDIHPEINRDLVAAGAMLHDFGKTEELSFNTAFGYTDKGKLIGHIVLAAMLINEEAQKIPGFPDDLKECLIHIVLSHQGKLEYASPVVPKTLEAITLYHADELSAKTNAYKNALSSDMKGEGKWTKFLNLAATDLFNHGIGMSEEELISKTLFD